MEEVKKEDFEKFKKNLETVMLPKLKSLKTKDRNDIRQSLRNVKTIESLGTFLEQIQIQHGITLDLNELKKIEEKKQKKNEDEEGIPQTSLYINEERNIMAEQVYDGIRSQFCVYNTKTGEITYEDEVDGYKPINAEEVTKKAVLLPSKAEEYGTEDELDTEIKNFAYKWLDIPKDITQFGLWNVKRSWVYQRFHSLNYLRTLGDTGLGKTRFLDTLGAIHYKPIMTSGATTSAPIFRIIDKWRGTMIFDEADLKSSDETDPTIKIINLGYEKGKFIMRCDQNDAEKIRFFDPFCPKIIATRKPFEDKATESRCITQVMTGTKRRDIPRNLNDEFWHEAEIIRNKLLVWRFRNYYKVNPANTPNFDFGIELEPRVEQIVSSFITLFNEDTEQMEIFKKFIIEHQQNLISERQNSWEGTIILTLHDLLEEGQRDISAKDIIGRANLTDRRTGQPLNPRALSKTLKELGFGEAKPSRIGEKTKRCLPLEQEHLDTIFNRYGVTKVTIVTQTGDTKKISDYANVLEKEQENFEKVRGHSNNRNNSNNRNKDFEKINILEDRNNSNTIQELQGKKPKLIALLKCYPSECAYCGKIKPIWWKSYEGKEYCPDCAKKLKDSGYAILIEKEET